MKKINKILLIILLSIFIIPQTVYGEEAKLLSKLKVIDKNDSWYSGNGELYLTSYNDNFYLIKEDETYYFDKYLNKIEEVTDTSIISKIKEGKNHYTLVNNKCYSFNPKNYTSERTVKIYDENLNEESEFEIPEISLINRCSSPSYCDEFYILKAEDSEEKNLYYLYIEDYYTNYYYKLTFNYDNKLVNQEEIEFNPETFKNSSDEENYMCNSKFCLLYNSRENVDVVNMSNKKIGTLPAMYYIEDYIYTEDAIYVLYGTNSYIYNSNHYLYKYGIEASNNEEDSKEINMTTSKSKDITDYFEDLKDYEGTINWKVSDKTIATIKNNIITPLKVGETDITATVQEDTYTLHLKVTETKSSILNPDTGIIKYIIILLVTLLILGTTLLILKKSNNKKLESQ